MSTREQPVTSNRRQTLQGPNSPGEFNSFRSATRPAESARIPARSSTLTDSQAINLQPEDFVFSASRVGVRKPVVAQDLSLLITRSSAEAAPQTQMRMAEVLAGCLSIGERRQHTAYLLERSLTGQQRLAISNN